MAGADLLDAPTGTAVAQRSEAGQGILGAKEGKGMWVWSAMVLAVLSSRMSAGGCSLAGRRDNVPCLAITAILKAWLTLPSSFPSPYRQVRLEWENEKQNEKYLQMVTSAYLQC